MQPPSNSLDLDFAVSAKVLRNPVRDVNDDRVAAPAPEPKVAAARASCGSEQRPRSVPSRKRPKIETPDLEASKPETPKPEVAQIETPKIETVTAPPVARSAASKAR